jgi:hypothetical protein
LKRCCGLQPNGDIINSSDILVENVRAAETKPFPTEGQFLAALHPVWLRVDR